MGRPHRERKLIEALGENTLEKIHTLREELIEVMKLEGSTIEEVSLKTQVNAATVVEFLRGTKFYRSCALSNAGSRTNKPPRDNISFNTYSAFKNYVLKRRKYLDL